MPTGEWKSNMRLPSFIALKEQTDHMEEWSELGKVEQVATTVSHSLAKVVSA